jgi:hypothetical protein
MRCRRTVKSGAAFDTPLSATLCCSSRATLKKLSHRDPTIISRSTLLAAIEHTGGACRWVASSQHPSLNNHARHSTYRRALGAQSLVDISFDRIHSRMDVVVTHDSPVAKVGP